MKNKLKFPTPLFLGFLQATGIYVYILMVAWFMFNGERFVGNTPSFLVPVFALTLFVTSALITSSMALYHPIILFFVKNNKARALQIVMSTAISLAFYTMVTISTIIFFNNLI